MAIQKLLVFGAGDALLKDFENFGEVASEHGIDVQP